MNGDELKTAKTELALALAQGVSVTAWARARSMARSAVYRWARDPEVHSEIEAHRRHAVDRAIGIMSKLSLPFDGVPASLVPGLRTAGGENGRHRGSSREIGLMDSWS